MLNEIFSQAQPIFTNTNNNTSVQGATGKLIGKAVVEVISPQSILQDALEEISFNFNKSDDCALKNRKERNLTERSMKERLKVFRKITNESNKDSDALIEALEQEPEREAMLKKALEQYKEPAEAWSFLEEARDKLAEKKADAAVLKEIDEALSLMDARYGEAIRAGICGSLTAAQNYVSLGNPLELGAIYRKAVLEFTSVMDLYSFVRQKYNDNFKQAVDFLYASLSADLACDHPSLDKFALESVNTSLGRLRSFQSAHAQCEAQLQRWENTHHVPNCGMNGLDLLGKVLKLGEQNFVSDTQADSIARDARPPDLERHILFLQELLQNIRNFSSLVFDKPEGRMRVLEAVQEAVDKAIDKEDELLAAQE